MLKDLRTSLGKLDTELEGIISDIEQRELQLNLLSDEADILIELIEKAEELKDLITKWQEYHKFI
jgi:hypothetical protein